VSMFLTAHQHIRVYSAIHVACCRKYWTADELKIYTKYTN